MIVTFRIPFPSLTSTMSGTLHHYASLVISNTSYLSCFYLVYVSRRAIFIPLSGSLFYYVLSRIMGFKIPESFKMQFFKRLPQQIRLN
jgi:hypothetical protein